MILLSTAMSNGELSKRLSPRELEVALIVGRGLSNKQVAHELGLSAGTVKAHVHSILGKLGARGRYGLILQLGELTRSSNRANSPLPPSMVEHRR